MTAPWTIPKKKPSTSKMSTRNVVKKHLKEWNFDDDEIKCSDCGKNIDKLEVFPGNRCVDCHETKFDEEVKRTGRLPKPDFTRTLN